MPSSGGDTARFSFFEWDENKSRSNASKHGIDFEDAVNVFADPHAVMFESRRSSGEVRYLAVGRVEDRCLTVVFTLRSDRIRIISARRARKSERQRYGQ